MANSQPIVLSIAGFDPSSGAGVTADIKTIAAHGCYGVTCITALTVQSTQGVLRVEPLPARTARDTLEALVADMTIDAVHVGMLGNSEIVRTVVEFQRKHKLPHLVLDPILKSSSGADLIDGPGSKALIEKLMPFASVVTPNVDEASRMTGLPASNPPEMKAVAEKLHRMGAVAVVITGGHLEPAVDLLSISTGTLHQEEFRSERQLSSSTHGTGCAFSTALACNLALGKGLVEAVMLAKAYVSVAIARGRPLGRGTGPVNHLYRLEEIQEKGKSS